MRWASSSVIGRELAMTGYRVVRCAREKEQTMTDATTVTISRSGADEHRIGREAYLSNEIFERELERIFGRSWVYLAHESEIPNVGDYRLSWIGRQSVIVTRRQDGEIGAMYNRCAHRGSTICAEATGNSRLFKCPYHGWTYDDTGSLLAVALSSGYADETFDKATHGLELVPRIGTYRGFIFGSADPTIIDLTDWLGDASRMIDAFVEQSPTGKIKLSAGRHLSRVRANWKFIGMDGYHLNFVHRSVRDALGETDPNDAAGSLQLDMENVTSERSPNLTRDLGNGHVRLDYWPSRIDEIDARVADVEKSDAGRKYVALMREAYGKERAEELIAVASPHTAIWPNLQLVDIHVRTIRSLAPDLTVVEMAPAMLEGVPDEINVGRVRQHEFGYGPSGFISPDDSIIFERCQLGLQAGGNPTIELNRGAHRVRVEDGMLTGHFTDEVTQRGQIRQWRAQMSDGEA
jgi:phenylpropionate dioxygenase-like ring-hydroxylating dioxygenase large terminal subunit